MAGSRTVGRVEGSSGRGEEFTGEGSDGFFSGIV